MRDKVASAIPEDLDISKIVAGMDVTQGNLAEQLKTLIQRNIEDSGAVDIGLLQLVNISGYELLSEDLRNQLKTALTNAYGADMAAEILKPFEEELKGKVKEATENATNEGIAQAETTEQVDLSGVEIDKPEALKNEVNVQTVLNEEIVEGEKTGIDVESYMNQLNASIENGTPSAFKKVDDSSLLAGLRNTASSVESYASRIKTAMNSISQTRSNLRFAGLPSLAVPTTMMASGGYPSVGEMFVANESGPELVGQIGRKTAVANTDQIVQGISAGVANGQSDQTSLLSQAVALLAQIQRKEFVARVQPSSELGRVNSRSREMYSRVSG